MDEVMTYNCQYLQNVTSMEVSNGIGLSLRCLWYSFPLRKYNLEYCGSLIDNQMNISRNIYFLNKTL